MDDELHLYDLVFPAVDSQGAGVQMHTFRAVMDYGTPAMKTWWMNTTASSALAGTVTALQEMKIDWSVVSHTEYGWASNGGNPYVQSVRTRRGTVWTKEEQWLDSTGNVTQKRVYNPDQLFANARTYNYSYLRDGYYELATGPHIRNRVTSATYTAGGQTYTLATNLYDGVWPQDNWAADCTGRRLHDAAYGTSYVARGNVTAATARGMAGTKLMMYDIGGNLISTTGGGAPAVDTTFANVTNYMTPATVTPNSQANLATSAQWDGLLRLTSATGPSGATVSVAGYDTSSRPTSTTSPAGAVTTYTYSK